MPTNNKEYMRKFMQEYVIKKADKIKANEKKRLEKVTCEQCNKQLCKAYLPKHIKTIHNVC